MNRPSGNSPFGVPAGSPSNNIIQQELQQARQECAHLYQMMNELKVSVDTLHKQSRELKLDWPTQFRHGLMRYPDLYPFPMVLQVELRTAGDTGFGLTNALAFARVQLDIDHPTILEAVSADLWKPEGVDQAGLLGTYLPLSSQRSPLAYDYNLAGTGYQGRDFQWRVRTSADNRVWQTGWRSSAQLDGDHRRGYILNTEYEFRRNDTLIIEAQPIGPVADPAQEHTLNFYLHTYKMLPYSHRSRPRGDELG